MSRPRRKMFGPLFYWTVAIALVLTVCAQVIIHESALRIAMRELSEWREKRALLNSLRSPDMNEREEATMQLVRAGHAEVAPYLLEAAQSKTSADRARACRYLVDLPAPDLDAVIPILAAASGDTDDDVRREAVFAFGCLITRGVIARVERVNGVGLGYIPPNHPVGHQTQHGSLGPTPVKLAPGLLETSTRALRSLLKDRSSEIRLHACDALAQFGADADSANDLALACSDVDRDVRLAAARALMKVNAPDDPMTANTLIALAADREPIGDRRIIIEILKATNEQTQQQAANQLARLLIEGDPAIHQDVIDCLVALGPRARVAVPALEHLLGDEDPAEQVMAAIAIASIEGGLTGVDSGGATNAAGGMGAPGGMMGAMGGSAASAATANFSPRVLEILLRMIEDVSVPVDSRQRVLELLRQSGDANLVKATPILIRQLAHKNPDVRSSAHEMLGSIIWSQPAEMPRSIDQK